jgi:hypothetical protein
MTVTTAVMVEPIGETSPPFKGNVAGVLCLTTILVEAAAAFVRWRLLGSGDATTTATNILAHLPLFRMLFVADLISASCLVAVTFLFYEMFKPASKRLSLLAGFFSLTRSGIVIFASLFQLAALLVLRGAQYLNILSVKSLPVLALMCLRLRSKAYNVSLVVLAVYCLLIGYLALRSSFPSRIGGAR